MIKNLKSNLPVDIDTAIKIKSLKLNLIIKKMAIRDTKVKRPDDEMLTKTKEKEKLLSYLDALCNKLECEGAI